MAATELSRADARRVALIAQGLAASRPKRVTAKHLLGVVDTLGGVQVDAVNVLARAHLFTFFSRLGPYDEALLHKLWEPGGGLVEYWMHGTSLMRHDSWPNYAWRMRSKPRRHGVDGDTPEEQAALAMLQREVDLRGEVSAQELEERTKPKEPWWDWTPTKTRLELLVRMGSISTARSPSFERTYLSLFEALPDEVVAARDAIDTEEARRRCVLMAARALGIAQLRDIRFYVWMRAADVKRILADLVAEGSLVTTTIEDTKGIWYLDPSVKPRPVNAAALVNPFDPFMWERDRIRHLFGFDYVLEIFVPEPKRAYGYYVLPFVLGEQIVARVDLKADRKEKRLLVQATYGEFGIDQEDVAHALAHELREVARWQKLDSIVVKEKGDFAERLSTAVG